VGVILPFSRKHESEADEYGLFLAARAGYDPRAAVRVWERMNEMGGDRPPEFLSTHPDPTSRIEAMKGLMPEAMRAYESAPVKRPNYPLPAISTQ
jgi:predicted Zn-dependent protease